MDTDARTVLRNKSLFAPHRDALTCSIRFRITATHVDFCSETSGRSKYVLDMNLTASINKYTKYIKIYDIYKITKLQHLQQLQNMNYETYT